MAFENLQQRSNRDSKSPETGEVERPGYDDHEYTELIPQIRTPVSELRDTVEKMRASLYGFKKEYDVSTSCSFSVPRIMLLVDPS